MFNLFLREPFFHFIAIGALIFVLYEFTVKSSSSETGSKIQITAAAIEKLANQWERRNGKRPDKDTLDELIESLIYEEVMLREAKRIELHKNDTIIRRRLVQKMEFLSANLAQMQIPAENSLIEYYEINKEKYRVAKKRSFTHVYFSKERRDTTLLDDANVVLQKLHETHDPLSASELGDNFILQYDYKNRSEKQIAQVFGLEFAKKLFTLKSAQWQGPVLSEYGAHLVYISRNSESYIPKLLDLRDVVLNDFMKEQLDILKAENYKEMRNRYQIKVDMG